MLPPFLYHGTSAEHAHSILKKGLRPSGGKSGAQVSEFSQKAVYLGEAAAGIFASSRSRSYRAHSTNEGILIEVDVAQLAPHKLMPSAYHVREWIQYQDDRRFDAIVLSQTVPEHLKKRRMTELLLQRYQAGEWSAKTHPAMCKRALNKAGELLYFGTIPSSSFTRVVFAHNHQAVYEDGCNSLSAFEIETDEGMHISWDEIPAYFKRLFDEQGMTPSEARKRLADNLTTV